MRLTLHDVGAAEQIPDAFAAIAKEGADGLLVAPHTLFFFNRVLVAESAAKSHLPAIYPYSEAATAGGLMSYASDLVDQMRRSAALIDKVLKGANPGGQVLSVLDNRVTTHSVSPSGRGDQHDACREIRAGSRMECLRALRVRVILRRFTPIEHAVVAHHADMAKPRALLQ